MPGLRAPLIFGLLALAAAEQSPDAADCKVDHEEVGLLQMPSKRLQGSWTLHEGTNCYEGHGAQTSTRIGGVSGYPECEGECAGSDGLVMDSMQTTCWCITGIVIPQCVTGTSYSTYTKGSGPSPSPPPSFCSRPCTFATELSDCGGSCGLCDGQLCIPGSPVTPAPQPSPTPPGPSPGGSWTLHEGTNCYDKGNGAETSTDMGYTPGGYPECEGKCAGSDGLVMDSMQTTCWCITGIVIPQCVTGTSYSTYVK